MKRLNEILEEHEEVKEERRNKRVEKNRNRNLGVEIVLTVRYIAITIVVSFLCLMVFVAVSNMGKGNNTTQDKDYARYYNETNVRLITVICDDDTDVIVYGVLDELTQDEHIITVQK